MVRIREMGRDTAWFCDTDRYKRHRALQSLATMKPLHMAVHAGDIARMLVDPSNVIVRLAARTLVTLFDCNAGPVVRMAAVKAVVDMMGHPMCAVRETAVIAMGKIALVGVLAPHIGQLVAMIDDPSELVSLQASCALLRQPSPSLSVYADSVAQKLTASREFVRKHALQTLCHVDPHVLAVYAHCISLRLSDGDVFVRESAVYAIACLHPVRIIVPYISAIVLLLDDHDCVRVAVCRLLLKLHPAALVPYVDTILLNLTDPSTVVRVAVVRILGKQEPRAFAPHASAISAILNGPHPRGEYRAARCAFNQFTKNLSKLFDSTNCYTRRKALDALCVAVGGYGCEVSDSTDRKLATLMQRADEDRSHQYQLVRLRRSYLRLDSQLGRWFEHIAEREFGRSPISSISSVSR